MMIQMVDRLNTTPIGQDTETLTFKALLYLDVDVHMQVCRLFCVLYIPLFSLVQLSYPAITNIFAVNPIINNYRNLSHNAETKDFARPTSNPVRGWTGKNKAFCSPGTQNDRRVMKVYSPKSWRLAADIY